MRDQNPPPRNLTLAEPIIDTGTSEAERTYDRMLARRGRPQIISTADMVRALKSSRSLREAADKLGVWHGAITQRTEPEIVAARQELRSTLPERRREAQRRRRAK